MNTYYNLVEELDNWLQDNNFMAHHVATNGACSANVVWEAICLKIVPNSNELLQCYKTLDNFVKAAASMLLEIDPENVPCQAVVLQGVEGLRENWETFNEHSLLDPCLGLAKCGGHIYKFVKDDARSKLVCTKTTLLGAPDAFMLDIMHYECPLKHFALMLSEASYNSKQHADMV